MQKTLVGLILGILIGLAIGYFLWEKSDTKEGRGESEWPSVICSNGKSAQEMLIAIRVKANATSNPNVAAAAETKLQATVPEEMVPFHSMHTVNAYNGAYPEPVAPVNWTAVLTELTASP